MNPAGRVAFHFGCDVPGFTDDDRQPLSPTDLRVIRPRHARQGEVTLFNIKVSALADLMDQDGYGTSLLFEEGTPKQFAQAVKALTSNDADTRRVAAHVLSHTKPRDDWKAVVTGALEQEKDDEAREQLEELVEQWSEADSDWSDEHD